MSFDLPTKKHSLAHIMAQAVKEHFPQAKLGMGPATDDGFYYDFDFGDAVITEADLKKIEKSMKKILSAKQKFIHFYVDYNEAREILKVMDEEFKNILIDRFESGDFKNSEKLESGKVGFSINTSKGKPTEYYAKLQEFLKEKNFYDFAEMDGDQVKNLKFIDMCAGPHIDNTSEIDPNSFALARIA